MDPETLLRHAGFVRAIARGLLAADAADDVVQDTMLAAWQKPPGDPSRARAWLGAVGRKLSLKRLRGDRRRDSRERGAARREALPSASEVLGQLEIQRKVVEAVAALEEPYRSTIVHRFFHDRSVGEIAEELGVPKKTVESRLTRALAMLRARLDTGPGGRRAWTVALLPLAWPRRATVGLAATGGAIVTAKTKIAAVAALLALAGVGVVSVTALRPGEEHTSTARAVVQRGQENAVPDAPGVATMGGAGGGEPAEKPSDASGLPPLPPAPPGGVIGRITCADGTPAGGASVWLYGNPEKDGITRVDQGGTTMRLETKADEQGVYRFERLVPGVYFLGASHVGHAPYEDRNAGYGVSATHGATMSVQLRRGGTLKVLLRDVAGEPVGGAEVEALWLDPIARAVSDDRGEARFEHLAHGGSVRVRARGDESVRSAPVDDERVTVVHVVVGASLVGTVVLEDGSPVNNASVRFFGSVGEGGFPTTAEAPIGATGRYRISGLPSGEYDAEVKGPGIASWPKRVTVGPDPTVTLSIQLGRPAVLGRVKRESSSSGLYVRLDFPAYGRTFQEDAAEDGSFAFYDFPPGEYTLRAWDQGMKATLPVVVQAGERIAGLELVLGPTVYGEVELEIVDAKGAYTGRVQLYVGDESGSSTSIAPPSVGLGRYRFQVAAGRARITVQWGKGSKSVDVDVAEGQTTYETVRIP